MNRKLKFLIIEIVKGLTKLSVTVKLLGFDYTNFDDVTDNE